jgi:chromosome partitioning protein
MRRVIAIANGKGGVGKTSLTAGLGGLLAAGGYRGAGKNAVTSPKPR